jgi:RHS repeat-associated protein
VGRAVALITLPTTDSLGNTTQHQFAVVVGSGVATSQSGAPAGGVLAVVNLDDPHNPAVVGFLALSTGPSDVLINGTVAYVGTENKQVLLVDIGAPATPTFLGTIDGDFGDRLAITSSGVLAVTSASSDIGGVVTAGLGGTPTRRPRPEMGPAKNCDQAVGQPINLANGNVWVSEADYSLPGLGGGIGLVRTWNSLWEINDPVELSGTFGNSWRSNYDERLVFPSGTAGTEPVRYWRGDGSVWYFDPTASTGVPVYVVSSPANRHVVLTSDPTQTVFTMTFEDGTKEVFNSAGYLTAISDRNSNQTTISYDAASRISSVTDPAGRVLSFNYPASGARQVQSIQDAVGVAATYSYDAAAHLTKVAYPDGSFLQMQYDVQDLLLSVTDAAGKVLEDHTYDYSRRGLTSERANGVDFVAVTYSGSGQASVVDATNVSTSYQIATFGGQSVVTSLNGPGCPTCGCSGNTGFTYDSTGNRLSSTDTLGHAWAFTYDSAGNLLSQTTQVGGSTLTWSYTYNNFAEILTSTDPLGNTSTLTYDANGNVLSSTSPSPDGSHSGSTTSISYDSKGEPVMVVDPLGKKTQMSYTLTGLLASLTDALGNPTSYTYDARGNRTSIRDSLGQTTNFNYDVMNRLIQTRFVDGSGASFVYDTRGRRVSATDPDGSVTRYTFDDADRLTSVIDAASNVVAYGHDNKDNLTSITDSLGRITAMTYDSMGRITQTTYPSGLTESYGYDAVNNLISRTDRNGHTTTFTYDQLHHLLQKTFPDSTSSVFTYDNDGRLTQVADTSGAYSFAYDNLGRLIQTASKYAFMSNNSLTLAYTYDANSNRVSMTDPTGGVTTYSYDAVNGLTGLTTPQNQQLAMAYDVLGRLTTLARPNGINTNYSFDSLSRILSVAHQKSGVTVDGSSYTYDLSGYQTSKTDQRSNLIASYSSDAVHRLTGVSEGSNVQESYTYDAVGNRLTSLGGFASTYNASNQLVSRQGVTYTYDNNGNPLTKVDASGTTAYVWDFENHLTSITFPGGGAVAFTYDPFGRRIQKTSPSGTTTYVYDGLDILEELDGSGNILAYYTQGPATDTPLVMQRGGQTYYYEADGLGSVSSLSSDTGSLANTYSYDSFGNSTSSGQTVLNSYQYTAREFDTETGLYYNRARYYDPSLGRFINEDPVHFRGGTNFYAYVDNDPVDGSDPSGLFPPWFHYQVTHDNASNIFGGKCAGLANTIADADKAQDDTHGAWEFVQNILGIGEAWKKGGTHFPSQALLDQYQAEAFSTCDPKAMGKFLHSFQDSQAHTWPYDHPRVHWFVDVPYTVFFPYALATPSSARDFPYSPPDYDAISNPERLQSVWDNTGSLLKAFQKKCYKCCN